ncbi:MAG TPA: deaminase [Candidatus Elarobacter sp.]|jgi:cytidine deaminase
MSQASAAGAVSQRGAVPLALSSVSESARRELVFGLVVPLGVEKDVVTKILRQSLNMAGYKSRIVKISSLLREYASHIAAIDDAEPLERKRLLMNLGDQLRRGWDAYNERAQKRGEFGAVLAISGIHQHRARLNAVRAVKATQQRPLDVVPVNNFAYIVDSLKHPDELDHLRRVYGPAFISIGVYSPPERRRHDLALDALDTSQAEAVDSLMRRDEVDTKLGQRVGDAFYATDFIVDATKDSDYIRPELDRLVRLLFGDVFITPTVDEYGMFLARAAQARSGSMARQIGSAILRDDGSVVGAGTNEVAKPLAGGQYWPPDDAAYEGRDMVYRMKENDPVRDSSDWFREEMISTVISALNEADLLPKKFRKMKPQQRLDLLYRNEAAPLRNTRIKDNIDYIRAVHAEAAAIIDAARHGVSVKDSRLLSTTFPCHECARHIVAAGITEVVYLEPYPKSGTKRLYRDSIALDPGEPDGKRVTFRTFIGVAPTRYLEFFTLGHRARKNSEGTPITIDIGSVAPALPYYTPSEASIAQAETVPLKLFQEFTDTVLKTGGLNEQSP